MIKTRIYVEQPDTFSSKLVFDGDLIFQLRAGDMIQIRDGFCAETVDRVYYCLPNNQEVYINTIERRQ